jgi:hypothetical protein
MSMRLHPNREGASALVLFSALAVALIIIAMSRADAVCGEDDVRKYSVACARAVVKIYQHVCASFTPVADHVPRWLYYIPRTAVGEWSDDAAWQAEYKRQLREMGNAKRWCARVEPFIIRTNNARIVP